MNLTDPIVAVAGDWHGNSAWAARAIRSIGASYAVRTILHVGDFWPDRRFLRAVDDACADAGIEQVLVTLGNHEPWNELTPVIERGAPAQVSDAVWVLPRPYRLQISGRSVLSLGGAASVDRQWRTPGRDWWPDEQITDAMVQRAIACGTADLMITHESPERTPVHEVRRILAGNPNGFPMAALAYSIAQREQIDRVWDAVRPELLVHGHMHVAGHGMTSDGRRVVALDCDGSGNGNVCLLDLTTMETTPLAV